MFFLFDDECYSKKPKKVTFNYEVYCILIPTRMELSFLKDDLWWCESDYTTFFYSAKTEINDFMSENSFTNLRDAKKMLYQPNSMYDDGDFFSGMYLFA
jgi:hypothetical protein